MSPLSKAALVAVSLALAGCKDINEAANLLEGNAPDAVPAALAAVESSVEPTYEVLSGTGPMGEIIATGSDCHPEFRLRICV
jgi:hypothetical protein